MSILGNKYPLLPVALIAVMAVAAGCGEEETTTSTNAAPDAPVAAVPMFSYSGPGSNWDYDVFDDGTYQVTHSALAGMDADLSVSGSYQVTAEGFLSLTIDASSGDDAPVRGGKAWALEIPNYALVLGPVSTADDHFVAMVNGGECPNTDLASNWINVRASLSSDSLSPEGSYFGSLDHSFADGSTVLTSRFALSTGNPAQGEYSLGNGFCQQVRHRLHE